MASTEPRSSRCGARTDNGHCEKFPSEGSTRCRLHGGASTGPKDTSHLQDNDFAEGNPGGGAPPLNTNATVHGAFGGLEELDARLDGEAAEHADKIYADLLGTSRAVRPEMDPDRRQRLAREWAVLSHQGELASLDFFERGPGLEVEREVPTADGGTATVTGYKANPTSERGHTIFRRLREISHELGQFDHQARATYRALHGEIESVDLDAEDVLRKLGEATDEE